MQITLDIDPKYIPEGYEVVGYRPLEAGELFVDSWGTISSARGNGESPWLVIRKVERWEYATPQELLDHMLGKNRPKMRLTATKVLLDSVEGIDPAQVYVRLAIDDKTIVAFKHHAIEVLRT